MSAPSFVSFVVKRPWLHKMMMPMANWYRNAAGYRALGLKFDDLIPEENETVRLALSRLSEKESYDRIFRIRRAFQCSLSHQLLPKSEHTRPSEDVPYLSHIIREIEAEQRERDDLDSLKVSKKAAA